MYQGGCKKNKNFGLSGLSILKQGRRTSKTIERTVKQCTMLVTKEVTLSGKCTLSGHCWAGKDMDLLNVQCTGMLKK